MSGAKAGPAILVVGAGAIGSFLAERFARAGIAATLVARGERLDDLLHNGLRVAHRETVESLPIAACGWDALTGTADVIALCTKTCDLADALDRLARFVTPSTIILTTQNGVEAPGEVAIRFPEARVLGSRVHGFFEMTDGTLRHVGVPPSLLFGPLRAEDAEAAVAMADLLTRADIQNAPSSDIMAALWEKFVLAAALGGVAAAMDIPAGRVLADDKAAALLREAMNEVAHLAHAGGIALPQGCVEATLAFVTGFPPEATTSLQRDLAAGRRSEYDALTGAVPRLAARLGVPVPAFEWIDRTIRAAVSG